MRELYRAQKAVPESEERRRACSSGQSGLARYCQQRAVMFCPLSRVDETGSSSYCWQPLHLRAGEKVAKVSPPVDEGKCAKKRMVYHKDVATANCYRLKQCTGHACSNAVLHRDRSAAFVIALKVKIQKKSFEFIHCFQRFGFEQ